LCSPRHDCCGTAAAEAAAASRNIEEHLPEELRHGTNIDGACCLSWALGSRSALSIDMVNIEKLHEQLGSCLQFFQADLVEGTATNGLILGPTDTRSGSNMTAADAMTRMGQLLCRWAASQIPPLQIYIGIEIGWLVVVELPNTRQLSCFGSAPDGARRLCEASIKEGTVHVSTAVRGQLSALRFLPMIIGSSSTYYLEAFTEVLDGSEADSGELRKSGSMLAMVTSSETEEKGITEDKMTFDSFCDLLTSNHVDLSRFGKGTANTLTQFYESVVLQEKCLLKVEDHRLFRLVELVRINLHFRNDEGQSRELRIKSEVTAGGQLRERNQPLAVVLRTDEHGEWEHAVERCFVTKFELSPAVQKACFNMPKDAYSYQETRGASDTIPGILTKYKTHTIKMTVKDRTRSELAKIGLPAGRDFATGSQGLQQNWTWARVTNNKEEELINLLQSHGISLDEFTWQSFVELYDEVYEKKQSQLEPHEGELVRYVRIIKIWLWANVLNCRHALVLRTKQQHCRTQVMSSLRVLSMRMAAGQSVADATVEAFAGRLGINEAMQREGLHISEAVYRQEVEFSRSFPGLKTMYKINEVHVEVINPQDQRWNHIGLPAAHDFTFVRQEQSGGELDTVVTRWGWTNSLELEHEYSAVKVASSSPSWSDAGRSLRALMKGRINKKRQVTLPEPLAVRGSHELLIHRLMEGKATDWARARRAAEQLRSPSYDTRQFHDDITVAFPELRLYCLINAEEDEADAAKSASAGSISQGTSAGRSSFEEYQRTIGALFCIFWLMRLHLDGKECFCFGLDNSWKPKTQEDFLKEGSDDMQLEYKKRKDFYDKADWDGLSNLFVGAGLMKKKNGPHDPERTLAMLVLMTIHDLMKLDKLRPICAKEFGGYKRGDQIGDHDIALSYVLERFPSSLPSFAGLSLEQQRSIRFTHSRMDYNMGWLVQAEAPPGALFRALRGAICEGQAQRGAADVAFYFAHWFADLAGAEPFPMQGCEKFVLKFPLQVLTNFVESFPVVWQLGPKTETEVYEDYLAWRWGRLNLGDAPTGDFALAKMRLVVMSQGDVNSVLQSFSELPPYDQEILGEELALTGCADQSFASRPSKPRGPAILIYYGPALMQKAGSSDPFNTMRVLAEVFRQARRLWPLIEGKKSADKTTILRIDALKELTAQELIDNHAQGRLQYVIIRNSEKDGQVKSFSPAKGMPEEFQKGMLLDFTFQHQAELVRWNSPLQDMKRALHFKSKTIPTFARTFSRPFLSFAN